MHSSKPLPNWIVLARPGNILLIRDANLNVWDLLMRLCETQQEFRVKSRLERPA